MAAARAHEFLAIRGLDGYRAGEFARVAWNALEDAMNAARNADLAEPDYAFIRRYASYFIRFGKPGSEPILIDALNQTSSLVDAPVLDFLESQHQPLVQAARAWASRHGYTLTGQPAGFLTWGDWGLF